MGRPLWAGISCAAGPDSYLGDRCGSVAEGDRRRIEFFFFFLRRASSAALREAPQALLRRKFPSLTRPVQAGPRRNPTSLHRTSWIQKCQNGTCGWNFRPCPTKNVGPSLSLNSNLKIQSKNSSKNRRFLDYLRPDSRLSVKTRNLAPNRAHTLCTFFWYTKLLRPKLYK